MRKVRKGLLLLVMCAALCGCGSGADLELKSLEDRAAPEESASLGEIELPGEETEAKEAEAEPEPVPIKVFVCGAVANEGVYELPEGSRVYDAVLATGGFAEDADETYVNQADFVSDAQKLYIPTKSEADEMKEAAKAPEESASGESGGLININTADESALTTLPGIGQARARSIIDYRQQNGPFEKPEDLMKVSGIGQAGFDKLKTYITVR
jgi:competence protein ComEA